MADQQMEKEDMCSSLENVDALRSRSPKLIRRTKRQISLRPKTKFFRGHNFKHSVAKGNARVQYGDTYNIGSCAHDTQTLQRHGRATTRSPTITEAQIKAALVSLLILKIVEDFFRYIIIAIPRVVGGRIAVFQDAFDRTWRIDIDTISSWREFEGLLSFKFENKSGLQRVRNQQYRLQDAHDMRFFDPSSPPEFRLVFRARRRIRMSIHFSWEEVLHQGCPKCRTEQASLTYAETICSTCKFVYVAGIRNTRQDSVHDEDPSDSVDIAQDVSQPGLQTWNVSECRTPSSDPDRPECFNRVSIGAEITYLPKWKHLVGKRVTLRNTVHVSGFTPKITGERLLRDLRSDQYFGRYGEIVKLVVTKAKDTAHPQMIGVYVTYAHVEDAAQCLDAVDGSRNGNSILRAALGTTRYCSAFLRGENCVNRNCLSLHEPFDETVQPQSTSLDD